MRRAASRALAAAARAAAADASACGGPSTSARPLAAAAEAWTALPAWSRPASTTARPGPPASPTTQAAPPLPPGRRPFSASALPPHTELTMPALSPTMAAGNLAAWHVSVGDAVAPGTLLADVETDKATLGWESMEDGFVAALLSPAGARDIPVGTPVAVLVEEAGDVGAFADYKPQAAAAAPAPAAAPAAAAAATTTSSTPSSSVPARLVGPAAARVLRQAGMTSAGLAATGPRGALTKADALAAVAGGGRSAAAAPPAPAAATPRATTDAAAAPARPAAPAPPQPAGLPPPRPGAVYEDVPHTQVRRVIAARLAESKATIPHAYLRGAASTAAVGAARAALASAGVKVSVNDFVIAAASRALAAVPALNVAFDEASGGPAPVPSIDVAFAVSTPGGLITPIITAAAHRSVTDISAAIRDLAGRARTGKLTPPEFMGGSFTVSNLGMFGVSHFSAIINPPQAAILAVGATVPEAVWAEEEGGPTFEDRLSLTLSFDARAVGAEDAAAWVDSFAAHFEDPTGLLEGGAADAAAA